MAIINKKVLKVLVNSLIGNSEVPLNVVYDVDDVLNNLNEYVFKQLGVTWRPRRFNVRECTDVSTEFQDKIIGMYGSPETFENLDWVDGAHEITSIEADGSAKVWINSNNFSDTIRDIKRHKILTELTEINPNRVVLQVSGSNDKKAVNADIVIEDHIINCLKYSDWAIKILIDKTWNQPDQYEIAEDFYHIIRVGSLLEANQAVREIIAAFKAEIQRS